MTDALDSIARDVIDANRYMTLGTADESGLPWVLPGLVRAGRLPPVPLGLSSGGPALTQYRGAPHRQYRDLQLAGARGPAQAVYMAAEAEELTGDALTEGIAVLSDHSQAQGMAAWGVVDEAGAVAPAGGSSSLHLYRATASEQFALDPAAATDRRTPVTP